MRDQRATNSDGSELASLRNGSVRNRSLDGIRGIAALVVFTSHCLQYEGILLPVPLATYSVWVFFTLSGLVLTRSWDGHYAVFLMRRFVRLWPMYALCLAAAYDLTRMVPNPLLFFWYPLSADLTINPPAWSLVVEAWAMLAMPAIIWFGSGSATRALAGITVCVLLSPIDFHLAFGGFFICGAWLSRYDWRLRPLEHPFFQWLGRISYPLYLCHAVVIGDLHGPFIVEVVLTVVVAQVFSLTVERWSIAGSRAIAECLPLRLYSEIARRVTGWLWARHGGLYNRPPT